MSFPDSGWLEKIVKAPTHVVLAVGLGTLFALWGPFDTGDPKWLEPILALFCVGAWTIIVYQISGWALRRYGEWQSTRLARRFGDLSQQQKALLEENYRTGTRSFRKPSGTTKLRWFEELELWGYVEFKGGSMFDEYFQYEITEKGWRELERKVALSA